MEKITKDSTLNNNNYKKINKYLLKNMSEKRRKHSLSTAQFMIKHAHFFDLDGEETYISGLAHDLCKEFSNNQVLKLSKHFIKRNLFPIDYFDFKLNYPNLLHGVAAAEFIYTKIKIENVEILRAICTHTLGGANLPKLAKYLFICDGCEPTRKHEGAKKVRKIITVEHNLNKALFITNKLLLAKLMDKQIPICLETIEGYNDSLKILNINQKKT